MLVKSFILKKPSLFTNYVKFNAYLPAMNPDKHAL